MLDVVEEVERVQKDYEGRGQILSNAAKHFAEEDQVEKMKKANERAVQGMSNTKQTKARGTKRLGLAKDEAESGARG
jgi:hypothetical protein